MNRRPMGQQVFLPTRTKKSYDSTTPYLGIHGDAGNSDVVNCSSADAFEEAWHVPEGTPLRSPILSAPMVL